MAASIEAISSSNSEKSNCTGAEGFDDEDVEERGALDGAKTRGTKSPGADEEDEDEADAAVAADEDMESLMVAAAFDDDDDAFMLDAASNWNELCVEMGAFDGGGLGRTVAARSNAPSNWRAFPSVPMRDMMR